MNRCCRHLREDRGTMILPVLVLLLVLIGVFLIFALLTPEHRGDRTAAPKEQYLAAEEAPQQQGFRVQDVPSWLFMHVAIIAGCQVSALIAAAMISRRRITRTRSATVLFLVEVPMYLGLFGTLLGVSLTQFITGSLVAPLAYLTTMSGIVLHVVGKLAIWLPLAATADRDE